jgi:glycosyltransferase involved in cell wall biosynthesis
MTRETTPLPVTVVVPVKNEEKNLKACLECLGGFQKIVVLDSNSTDRTRAIAESSGATVINFNWDGKFPKKRNWYLRNHVVSTPWVLFVDADEYLSEDFKRELAATLPGTGHAGFWLSYHNYFLGRYLKHGDIFTKLALFRVGEGEYERVDDEQWSSLDMEVHEHPVLNGTTGTIASAIRHEDFKGMRAYFQRHNEYSTWEAKRYIRMINDETFQWDDLTFRQKTKYRLLNSWLLGPLFFLYAYFYRLGILDGIAGFAFALCKMIYFWQIKVKIVEHDTAEGNARAVK